MDLKDLMPMQQRQPAQQVWMHDLLQGVDETSPDETEPYHILVGDKKIFRVSVIGTVVDSYMNADNSFSSITLDDGTATMRLKAFKEDTTKLSTVKIGDLIHSIGRVRKFNDERYIVPETVKILEDPHQLLENWLALSKESPFTPPPMLQSAPQHQDTQKKSLGTTLLAIITTSGEEGMNIAALEQASNLSREAITTEIESLVNDGEIYQFKPGHYKRL